MVGLAARFVVLALGLCLAACVALVAPYDATFDQSLNELSGDTATFLAAVKARGPERDYASAEATAYYAASNNVMERLIARATLTRGRVACPASALLDPGMQAPGGELVLPPEAKVIDCREFQLYGVRYYLRQLEFVHREDRVLNAGNADAAGNLLQRAIIGSIQTFAANKPSG